MRVHVLIAVSPLFVMPASPLYMLDISPAEPVSVVRVCHMECCVGVPVAMRLQRFHYVAVVTILMRIILLQ